jgi:anaerobic magnesium-protoporphyrin IX monomethyl ester cyclase
MERDRPMLSILVCHSYFMGFDTKQRERAKPYPPLATLQVAAALRGAGHDVSVFDAMLADGVEQFETQLRERRPQLVLLYEDNYNFLTKMCLARMREAACRMIRGARAEGARVIAAGSDASDSPDPYLQAGADAVLLGEGLGTLFALVPRLDANPHIGQDELIGDLPGVVRAPGMPGHSSNAAHLPSPQLCELPAWDLIDIERYRRVWQGAHGFFSLNMAASRGCPFRCTWCAKPIWGNQYLQRGAGAVAAEMMHLKGRFRPDHIWFADDIFGFRVDWVMDFAAAVRSSGGSIPFTIQTRADLISERMAQALALAGCKEAWLGAESGSQKILDAMSKGTTVQQIHTARARLKAAGIRVGFFIQLGYLGEELPDIIATRELISSARPDDIGVSVSYPLPGTRFHELVREQLRDQTRWQDSNDLAMMFRGTYTSEFYREVRNLLHAQVERQTTDLAAEARADDAVNEGRWVELLSRERQYRSPERGALAK